MGKPKQKLQDKSDKKFLETLPGVITAIAALITAIGGILAIFLSPQAIPLFFRRTATPIILPSLTATVSPTSTFLPVTPSPTATEIAPKMYGFQSCPAQCNGQNSTNNFVGGIKKIYIQFNYENIPPKAPYTRTWTMDGKEWARYNCAWDGPSSGTETIKLSEPDGLNSGVWEMTIIVNEVTLLKAQLVVVGDFKFWTPVGTKNGVCRANN